MKKKVENSCTCKKLGFKGIAAINAGADAVYMGAIV
jgi:hypothetical protein